MDRVEVHIKPVKSKASESMFALVSWPKKIREEIHFSMKNNDTIHQLITHIHSLKPELRGKYILKCGDIPIGSKRAPINKKISEVWDVKGINVPILKIITPDKYPAAGSRAKDENPLYSIEFLLTLNGYEPSNLHGCCIFNKLRLGRGDYTKNAFNNHPSNLIMIKTPYGNFLSNIYATYYHISSNHINITDPLDNFDVIININDKKFKIPKRTENSSFLKDIIRTYKKRNCEERNVELYVIDMVKQESFASTITRWFTN
jgi:hypothetical protein